MSDQQTKTLHTCAARGAFGKREPGCPRCAELDAGAAPRRPAWLDRTPEQREARLRASRMAQTGTGDKLAALEARAQAAREGLHAACDAWIEACILPKATRDVDACNEARRAMLARMTAAAAEGGVVACYRDLQAAQARKRPASAPVADAGALDPDAIAAALADPAILAAVRERMTARARG